MPITYPCFHDDWHCTWNLNNQTKDIYYLGISEELFEARHNLDNPAAGSSMMGLQFNGKIRSYTQAQVDEVRVEWAKHVASLMDKLQVSCISEVGVTLPLLN